MDGKNETFKLVAARLGLTAKRVKAACASLGKAENVDLHDSTIGITNKADAREWLETMQR